MKALINCIVTVRLICAFVFAYAKSRGFYDEAQIIVRVISELVENLLLLYKNCSVLNCYELLLKVIILLAHLSQRLIGELIGYPWSGIRCPSSSASSSVHNFKSLLL